jgi:hypothetical protein
MMMGAWFLLSDEMRPSAFGLLVILQFYGVEAMNIKARLTKLEAKLNQPLVSLFIVYQDEEGLSDEQKARISEAEAIGQTVKLICTRCLLAARP